jgi:hypothetical protein
VAISSNPIPTYQIFISPDFHFAGFPYGGLPVVIGALSSRSPHTTSTPLPLAATPITGLPATVRWTVLPF